MSPVNPFDDSAPARAVVDATGRLREWNEAARGLLGYSPGAVLGRPLADLLVVGGPPFPDRDARRWSGSLTLRHRDGHSVSVWAMAHRPAGRDGAWVVVVPRNGDSAEGVAEDPLIRAALRQSPCATMVFDTGLRLRGANDAMARLLDVPARRLRGLRPTDIGSRPQHTELEENLRRVLDTGRGHDMRAFMKAAGESRGAHAWSARLAPLADGEGRVRGVCVSVHDFTEQHRARERLQLVSEAGIRIGSTLDVTRTAQELATVCVPGLADLVTVDLLDRRDSADGRRPPGTPIRLRRVARASAEEDTPRIAGSGRTDDYPAGSPQAESLTTGHAVAVPPLVGGTRAETSPGAGGRDPVGPHAILSVPLRARGTTLGVAVFTRFGHPEPFTADDVLLAEEIAARAAVSIDNARRYSRERETTLTLQRSLLPRALPTTGAVETASRYLPAASSGVGGDWFDVIPLSGTRVAMVVGDVAGHGIPASAAMGRLRTAVRTLADLDLAPEELLAHLDDLVVRLASEPGERAGETGTTCLYAVYDPISRRCALARAGHPAPVLVEPDGRARLVDLPSGPPLGIGGLPFESVELSLPEGSLLALYTDGLVGGSDHDAESGGALLSEALAAPAASLEETCDRVLRSLPRPDGDARDVALLLARTRVLPCEQVATWDIPADAAMVAPVRKQVLDQLDGWGLREAAFPAELVASELVTNAIRYGSAPIRLRLIHDAATLICEVSDSSHTAPHLRRARTWDEGGRGLLLVAQLTRRWGSRHTAEGKTIWAELALLGED
ncbi:SpoIIE family protein phosphatase [Streptomyces sp. WMMC905]|uniref:SpoIIE family protein phosphatase n=1 Tax=Streptomyces sp. WMMC905 TaxID=3404123 RepID=UPI003B93B73A